MKRKDPEDLYEWKDCEYLETVSSILEEVNLMSKASESEHASLKNVNPIVGTRKSQRKQIYCPNDKKPTSQTIKPNLVFINNERENCFEG